MKLTTTVTGEDGKVHTYFDQECKDIDLQHRQTVDIARGIIPGDSKLQMQFSYLNGRGYGSLTLKLQEPPKEIKRRSIRD